MSADVNRPAYVLGFSAAVSAGFTAAIMALHAASAPTVERNRLLFERRGIVDVFGLGGGRALSEGQILALYRARVRPLEVPLRDPQTGAVFNDPAAGPRTFLATGADGRPLGYALPVWGIGFWARIEGYLAVTPDLGRLLGVVFLRHGETPGLGGRLTEPAWRAQFAGLDVRPPGAGGQYLYVGGDPPASAADPRAGRRVDALTGATGTSSAVEAFLNARLAEFHRAAAAAKLGGPAGRGADGDG